MSDHHLFGVRQLSYPCRNARKVTTVGKNQIYMPTNFEYLHESKDQLPICSLLSFGSRKLFRFDRQP